MKIKLLTCLLVFLLALPLTAAPPKGKSAPQQSMAVDNTTFININKILMFVTNHGNFGRDLSDRFGYDYGTFYPYTSVADIESGANTTSPNYATGLWVGAIDSVTGDTLIVVSEYDSEYVPGPMADSTFSPDQPYYKVFKLFKDSLTANPNQDFLDYITYAIPAGAPDFKEDTVWNPDSTVILQIDTVLPYGDQMLWSVFNDADAAQHANDAGETDPLGIEVRQTTFAFQREDELGEMVFFILQIFNKGEKVLDNTFFSIWCDPDLGLAGDDFVGCDTTLDLGFVYNADNDDQQYGSRPPALGIDFFQGPLFENDTLTARMWGQEIAGYGNLGLSSFNKYINGTDPHSYRETWWYMNGLNGNQDGAAYVNPDGIQTKFYHAGDPVTGIGDLDNAPADRRWMQTTGPIKFRPGDSTEIIASFVIGQGGDRKSSISVMKYNDKFAQTAYENNFVVPEPPAPPDVSITALDGEIILTWSDTSEIDHGDYPFQGYSVYQGTSAAGPWTLVGNYDLVDGYSYILDDVLDPLTGALENRLVKQGSDNGLRRYFVTSTDELLGGKLINYTTYYFRVQAYSFSPDPEATPKTLTSFAEGIPITPMPPVQDTIISTATFDTLAWTHSGGSNGTVIPLIVDPGETNADSYRVVFKFDTVEAVTSSAEQFYTYDTLTDTCDVDWDTAGDSIVVAYCIDTVLDSVVHDTSYDTTVTTYWELYNLTADSLVLTRQFNQSGDEDYAVIDGILLKVTGPAFGVVAIQEVADATGPITPDNVMWSLNSTADWYVGSDQSSNFARLNWQGLIGTSDWEMRFTATGQQYYNYQTDHLFPAAAPFEFWNIGIGTPDDAGDDVQINFMVIDDDASGGWTYGDRIYAVEEPYTSPAPDPAVYVWPDDWHIGRIVINDYSEETTAPAEGTIIRFTTAKINTPADTFTFQGIPTAAASTRTESGLDAIKAVPNPYYLYGPYDPVVGNTNIKFTHLPSKCTISIYNLGGDFIAEVVKDDPSTSETTWNVQTREGLPVASGIYIYVVDAPGYGTKIGKMAVFTEAQVLDIY